MRGAVVRVIMRITTTSPRCKKTHEGLACIAEHRQARDQAQLVKGDMHSGTGVHTQLTQREVAS